ncbi:MAG: arsenate reductase ArsC [Gammaproteobacteria bacterium]
MTDHPYYVLFLCTGNSARSIIAECVLNRLGHPRFKAYSAGSFPKGEVNPYALQRLKAEGYDVSELRSKSWDEFTGDAAPQFDFVFTLCDSAAAEPCPVWPGQPVTAHWGLPDPATLEGREAVKHAAFADTLRMLNNRIRLFLSLPLARLDRLSLQKNLNDIGNLRHADRSA